MKPRKIGIYEKCIKRSADIFFSFFALLFLLPIYILIAILVRFKLGSPILFKQSRLGKNEKIFMLDVWYTENISLSLDIKTVFLTFKKVFAKEGISSRTSATMEEFRRSTAEVLEEAVND